MSDLLHGLMGQARGILVAFMVIMAMAFVVMTWARTRSLVPTLGSILLGAVVVIGVANFTLLSNEIGEDVNEQNDSGDNIGDDVTVLQPGSGTTTGP